MRDSRLTGVFLTQGVLCFSFTADSSACGQTCHTQVWQVLHTCHAILQAWHAEWGLTLSMPPRCSVWLSSVCVLVSMPPVFCVALLSVCVIFSHPVSILIETMDLYV